MAKSKATSEFGGVGRPKLVEIDRGLHGSINFRHIRAPRRRELLQTRNKELLAFLERASIPQKRGSKAKGIVFGEGLLMKLNARGAHCNCRVASLLASFLRLLPARTQSRGGLIILERWPFTSVSSSLVHLHKKIKICFKDDQSKLRNNFWLLFGFIGCSCLSDGVVRPAAG
jgi:hypothetical protein